MREIIDQSLPDLAYYLPHFGTPLSNDPKMIESSGTSIISLNKIGQEEGLLNTQSGKTWDYQSG